MILGDIDLIVSCRSAGGVEVLTRRRLFFMGWFYASSGRGTPQEQQINQLYSKIHFSYPPMSRFFRHTCFFSSARVLFRSLERY